MIFANDPSNYAGVDPLHFNGQAGRGIEAIIGTSYHVLYPPILLLKYRHKVDAA